MLEQWRPVIEWTAIGGVAALAAMCDVRTGRVPNVLTFGAMAGGLLFSAIHSGGWGLLTSLLGCVIGLALFLPLFVLGGMGGGDVKLLAAVGAWLGPVGALRAALWASLAGGVLAVIVGISSGYLSAALRNLFALLGVWSTVGPSRVSELTLTESRGPRLAYAVPIGIGAIVALWLGRQ
jgi:prepilin peptidase CpaA